MNFEFYPWLRDLSSPEAREALEGARQTYLDVGAVTLPNFVTPQALETMAAQARAAEDDAFTTDSTHTAYLTNVDLERFDKASVFNHAMRTQVASTAFDELPPHSPLAALYRHDTLLQLVSWIVTGKFDQLFLSADPLGACSINVFRPNYHHSFHFDESVFSTTLMLQEASEADSGLFQYTPPLRANKSNLALTEVAAAIQAYDKETPIPAPFAEIDQHHQDKNHDQPPLLRTLDFSAGTLSIFSGSRSLHRVTRVRGTRSRLVAVLTYGTQPGFCNSGKWDTLEWQAS